MPPLSGDRPSFDIRFALPLGTSAAQLARLHDAIVAHAAQTKLWSLSKFQLHPDSLSKSTDAIGMRMRVKIRRDWKWADESKWREAKGQLILALSTALADVNLAASAATLF
eukprot:TRINITY_DN430_c0_g1_i3.p1 TRINITY_DN430_c0_g1~~TRINITY_DN430_c0_g1_i3.p1  ORF type:complete len:111 (+),score=14.25 TRINITY_DN430_c0_g1_i3:103-435(+)